MKSKYLGLLIFLAIFAYIKIVEGSIYSSKYGVLVAQTPGKEDELFCMKFYPELFNVSAKTTEEAQKFPMKDIRDLSDQDTCSSDGIKTDIEQKIAIVSSGKNGTQFNCTIDQRARIIEAHHAVAVLSDGTVSGKFNTSESGGKVNITVASLINPDKKEELLDIKKSHPQSKFLIYSPEMDREFDPSILLILFMAVFTVALGSIWSGYTKHYLRLKRQESFSNGSVQSHTNSHNLPNGSNTSTNGQNQMSNQHPNEDISLRISPLLTLVFVFSMCIMLVLLYFFFDKLAYVILAMFCIASTIATYSCFEPLVMWSYEAFPNCPTVKIPRCNLYLCILNMELRQFLLLVASISLSAVWFVYRKTEWSWILQDFLGILFSLNMLKVFRLPSFKICVILLCTLFFYDVFFVFITPLITKDGKSIMVEVATGGSTGETLPMLLRVPYFNENPMRVCWTPYSMLGFGDILVPGLLLSYCHSFDLLVGNHWKIYWITTNIAYILGLVATYISLFLMNSAQPALLYLVPFTLIPTAIVAALRGDLKAMWDGDFEDEDEENEITEDDENDEEINEGERSVEPTTTPSNYSNDKDSQKLIPSSSS